MKTPSLCERCDATLTDQECGCIKCGCSRCRDVPRCSWCNVDPIQAAKRHEGPHLTWCVHYRTPPLLDTKTSDEKSDDDIRWYKAQEDAV